MKSLKIWSIHDCVENNVLRPNDGGQKNVKQQETEIDSITTSGSAVVVLAQASCTSVIEMLVRTIVYAVDMLFKTNHRIL